MPATDLTLECLVHDLNNVFQTLVEASELLATDPKWAPLSAIIQRSVDRGRGIVESLRPDRGIARLFEEIASDAIAFVEDLLPPGRLRFHREFESGIELRFPWAWERVLINLFLNSAQANPGGGAVWVRARRLGGDFEITVEDDGPGIAPAILADVFKPHVSTKASPGGLGLHIVDTIVRQNDGRVTAANRAGGRGASFIITVPAAPA